MIRPIEQPPQLAGLGVDEQTCIKAQCGLINLATAALYECSAAGYAGVRTPRDPICQELIGGGEMDVAAAVFEADGQALPGTVMLYDLTEDGAVYESNTPSNDDGHADDIATTYQPPEDTPAPEATETPEETPGEPEPELMTEEEWRNLIGDPNAQFSDAPTTTAGTIEEWLQKATDAAKAAPWWLWVSIVAATYYATRKKGRKR